MTHENPVPNRRILGKPSGYLIGRATAQAPATCGELVQGMTGGADFLVTCPINQFAGATVTLRAGDGAGRQCRDNGSSSGDADSDADEAAVRGVAHRPKTRRAVALALPEIARRAGIAAPLRAEVSLTGAIPAGKGMGSSSADIAAAVAAAGLAAGCPLPPADIARIALSVEPTDGVMFPGIALFDHRRGRIAESLGPPPPMEAIVIDRGGQVDTLAFNAVDRAAQWSAVADRTEAALELVRAGVRRQDAGLIGRGATVSARAGRPPDAADWVERAIGLAEDIGAAGVNVAHSGTVIGILLDARRRQSKPAYRRAVAEFGDAESVRHFRVIGGGVRLAA